MIEYATWQLAKTEERHRETFQSKLLTEFPGISENMPVCADSCDADCFNNEFNKKIVFDLFSLLPLHFEMLVLAWTFVDIWPTLTLNDESAF